MASHFSPPDPKRPFRQGVVLAAIHDAVTRGDGEVTIEQGDFRGAVHVHEGLIAWVRVSTELESVTAFFPDAQKADARRLLELCKSTKANVFESAIALRLATRDEVRARLRSMFRRRLNEILLLSSPSVSFAPRKFTYGTDLRFALDELVLTPKTSYTRMRAPGAYASTTIPPAASVPPTAASIPPMPTMPPPLPVRSSPPPLPNRSVPPPLPSRASAPASSEGGTRYQGQQRPTASRTIREERVEPRPQLGTYDFEQIVSAALRYKGVAGASIVDLDQGRPVLVRGIGPSPAAIATYIAMPTAATHFTPARLPAAGRSVAVFFALPRSPRHVLAVVVLQGGAILDDLEMTISRAILSR